MLEKTLEVMIRNIQLSSAMQYRTFKNGLTVTIRPYHDDYQVTLSREDDYPEDADLEKVLNHFPYTVNPIDPPVKFRDGEYKIRCTVQKELI